MNSDYDITLSSSESASAGSARNRFLDSLGVGEASMTDEGLVLSSQPDLCEPEASVELSKGRAISISVNRGAVHRSVEIEVPGSSVSEQSGSVPNEIASPEKSSQPQAEDVHAETESAGIGEADLEDIISLNCPECAGELVIKRRHLGVEGACVWCHAPIVAAQSARDHQVRVFPILGGIQKAPTIVNRTEETRVEASPDPSPAPWKPLDCACESNLPAAPKVPLEEVLEPASPANQGFSPSFESAVPAGDCVEDEENRDCPVPIENSAPMDLEDLYASAGFGEPAKEEGVEPGFGETLADPSKGATTFSPAGFGDFLQSPAVPSGPDIDSPPPPHTANIAFSGFGPSLPAPASPSHAPAAPVGFATPAPWGPPTKSTQGEAVMDAPPALIQEEPSPANWASGFENLVEPKNASVSLVGEDSQEPSSSNAESMGFDPPSGSVSPEFQSPASGPFSSEVSFGIFDDTTPSSQVLFGSGEASVQSPAMPGHCFSTGSSSDTEPKTFDSLFPPSEEKEIHSSIIEGCETHPPDEAPAPLAPSGGDSLFPATDRRPNLFGDSPFVSFQEEPANEPPMPSFQGSAFAEEPPASNPLFAGPESSPAAPVPTESAAMAGPGVPPLPPLAKPKPKVRKGFMVLMVVIVGFASGAALASFVLPVEEYVETARAFMETKFNPAGQAQQAIPLPLSSSLENLIETTEP